jgi:hypothetical protein
MACEITQSSGGTVSSAIVNDGIEDDAGTIAVRITADASVAGTCTLSCTSLTNIRRMPTAAADWVAHFTYTSLLGGSSVVAYDATTALPTFTAALFAPAITALIDVGTNSSVVSARTAAPLSFSLAERGPELVASSVYLVEFPSSWNQSLVPLAGVSMVLRIGSASVTIPASTTATPGQVYRFDITQALVDADSTPDVFTDTASALLTTTVSIIGYARSRLPTAVNAGAARLSVSRAFTDVAFTFARQNNNLRLPTIVAGVVSSYSLAPRVPLARASGHITTRVEYPSINIASGDSFRLTLPTFTPAGTTTTHWSFPSSTARVCFINGTQAVSSLFFPLSSGTDLSVTVRDAILNRAPDETGTNFVDVSCEAVIYPLVAVPASTTLTASLTSGVTTLASGTTGTSPPLDMATVLGGTLAVAFTLSSLVSSTSSELTVTVTALNFPRVYNGAIFEVVMPDGFTYPSDNACTLKIDDNVVASTLATAASGDFRPLLRAIRLTANARVDDTLTSAVVIHCSKVTVASYGREATSDGAVRLILLGDPIAASSPAAFQEFVAAQRLDATVPAFTPSTTLGGTLRAVTWTPAAPNAGDVVTVGATIWPLVNEGGGQTFPVEAGAAIELLVPAAAVDAGSSTMPDTTCSLTVNIVDASTSFANTIAVTTEAEAMTNVLDDAPTKEFVRLRVRIVRAMTLPADTGRRIVTLSCTNIRLSSYGLRASRVGQLLLVNSRNQPMSQRADLAIPAVTPRRLASASISPVDPAVMTAGSSAQLEISFASTLAIDASNFSAQDDDYYSLEVVLPTGFSVQSTRTITCRNSVGEAWNAITRVDSYRGAPIFRFPLKLAFDAVQANQRLSLRCRWVLTPRAAQAASAWNISLLATPVHDVVGTLTGTVTAVQASTTTTNFGGVTRDVEIVRASTYLARVTATINPAPEVIVTAEQARAVRMYLPETWGLTAGATTTPTGPGGTPATITCVIYDGKATGAAQVQIGGATTISYISDDLGTEYPDTRLAVITFVPSASLTNPIDRPTLIFQCSNLPIPPVDYLETRDIYIGVNSTESVTQVSTMDAVLRPFVRNPVGTDASTSVFSPDSLGAAGTYKLTLSPVLTLGGVTVRVPVPPGTTRASDSTPIVCWLASVSTVGGTTTETTVTTMASSTWSYPFEYVETGPLTHNLASTTVVTLNCNNLRAPTSPSAVSGLMLTSHGADGAVLNRNIRVSFAGVGARDLESTRTLRLNPAYVDVISTLLFTFEPLPFQVNIEDRFVVDAPAGVTATGATRCLVGNLQAKSFKFLPAAAATDPDYSPIGADHVRLEIIAASAIIYNPLRTEMTVSCVFMKNPVTVSSSSSNYKLRLYSRDGVLRARSDSIAFQGVLPKRLGTGAVNVRYSTPFSYQPSTMEVTPGTLSVPIGPSDRVVMRFPLAYEPVALLDANCTISTKATASAASVTFATTFTLVKGATSYDLTVVPTPTIDATSDTGSFTLSCTNIRTPRTYTASQSASLSVFLGSSSLTAALINNELVMPLIDYTELAKDYGVLIPSNGRVANTATTVIVLTVMPLALAMEQYGGIEFVIPVGDWRMHTDSENVQIEPVCQCITQSGITGGWVNHEGVTHVVATSASLTVRFILTESSIPARVSSLTKLSCSPIDVPAAAHGALNNIVARGLTPRSETANTVTDDFLYHMRTTSIGMPAILDASQATQITTYVRHSITLVGLTAPITQSHLASLANTFATNVIASGGLAQVTVTATHQYAVETSSNTLAYAAAAAAVVDDMAVVSSTNLVFDEDAHAALETAANARVVDVSARGVAAARALGLSAGPRATSTFTSTLYFRVDKPETFTDDISAFADRLVLIHTTIDQALREESRAASVSSSSLSLVDQPNTCRDGVRSGSETGPDCGGSVCVQCAVGVQCTANSDCMSSMCDIATGRCIAYTGTTSAAAALGDARAAAVATAVAALLALVLAGM